MIINDNIYANIENVTHEINYLSDGLQEGDAGDKMIDDFSTIIRKVAYKEADPEDFKDLVKQNMKDGENKDDATDDAYYDNAIQTFDGTLNLGFIPRDSVLGDALYKFYDHIARKTHAKFAGNFDAEVEHYARSGVPVHALDAFSDEDPMNNPEGVDGFFFAFGEGYRTTDELFSGMPHSNVGTGYYSTLFIHFLNFDCDRQNDKEFKKAKADDTAYIKETYHK